MKKDKKNGKAKETVVLWFEQSLGDEARAKVKELSKELGVKFVDGVKCPQIVTVERGH
jgi:hypothetical protein